MLSTIIRICEVYTYTIRRDNDNIEKRVQAIYDTSDALLANLQTFDRNYNKVTSDYPILRKVRTTTILATSNDTFFLEVQSLRYSILVLVKVSKTISISLVLLYLYASYTNYLRSLFVTTQLLRVRLIRLSILLIRPQNQIFQLELFGIVLPRYR